MNLGSFNSPQVVFLIEKKYPESACRNFLVTKPNYTVMGILQKEVFHAKLTE